MKTSYVRNNAPNATLLYSVVETAKENGLNPTACLTQLFQALPNIDVNHEAQLDALLPWNVGAPRANAVASDVGQN